jgi:hypothetical protein
MSALDASRPDLAVEYFSEALILDPELEAARQGLLNARARRP